MRLLITVPVCSAGPTVIWWGGGTVGVSRVTLQKQTAVAQVANALTHLAFEPSTASILRPSGKMLKTVNFVQVLSNFNQAGLATKNPLPI
jgi:hypothetical protein